MCIKQVGEAHTGCKEVPDGCSAAGSHQGRCNQFHGFRCEVCTAGTGQDGHSETTGNIGSDQEDKNDCLY